MPQGTAPRFADVLASGRTPSPLASPGRGHAPPQDARLDAMSPRTPRADEREERGRSPREDASTLDPSARIVAQLAPPLVAPTSPPPEAAVVRAVRSLEDLLPAVVRKIAWAGDARRGSVRLELGGDGAYAGAVVCVHAEAGVVRVDVAGRDDATSLRERLEHRLRRRGLDVDDAR